ncbi:MAG: hypothetical protein ISQ07_07000 [Pirellulales bacterium]|nr:hypothetical protein [Pirellulales bacterium]
MNENAVGLPRLTVLLGRADDMRAVVYVKLLDAPGDAKELTGSLRGPRCLHASTLPTTARLRMLPPVAGTAQGAACEAVLVEPGFWSPELPNRYQLELSGCTQAGVRWSGSRLIGICRFGHFDGAFRLDGRRYVLRAVEIRSMELLQDHAAALTAVRAARAASAGLWGSMPPPALCDAADAEGVMLAAELPAALQGAAAADEVCRLAVHPSVGFLVVDREHAAAVADWRGVCGTMQLGLRVDGQQPPPSGAAEPALPAGIDCLVMELSPGELPHEAWRKAHGLPVIVRRPLSEVDSATTGPQGAEADSGSSVLTQRQGCDLLQAAMASWLAAGGTPAWEPAGYVVAASA